METEINSPLTASLIFQCQVVQFFHLSGRNNELCTPVSPRFRVRSKLCVIGLHMHEISLIAVTILHLLFRWKQGCSINNVFGSERKIDHHVDYTSVKSCVIELASNISLCFPRLPLPPTVKGSKIGIQKLYF